MNLQVARPAPQPRLCFFKGQRCPKHPAHEIDGLFDEAGIKFGPFLMSIFGDEAGCWTSDGGTTASTRL